VAGPTAGLRTAGVQHRTGSSSTCALSMQQDAPKVSRKNIMQLAGLALAGAFSLPQDAAAFADNFYIPNVSDGAGGSIAKSKKKPSASKEPPAQVRALAEEGVYASVLRRKCVRECLHGFMDVSVNMCAHESVCV